MLHVSPQGLLIQLAGAPIVNWIGANLQEALRNKGKPAGRADEHDEAVRRRGAAQLLLLSADLVASHRARSLGDGRARAQPHGLPRSSTSAAPARPPSSPSSQQAESLTRTSLAVFRSRFLLDSPMARADLNAMVDQAKRLLREVEEITRRLGAAPATASNISGAWKGNDGGVYAIRQAGTTVTWTGRSQDRPDASGKVSWYHAFTGTIRDGRYIVGTYRGHPGEEPRSVISGPLVVEIVSANELRKIAGYAGVTSARGSSEPAIWTR